MKRIDTFLRAAAIALFIIMCLLSAAFASSEETNGEGTENIEYEYEITITPPRGWYADSADITITIRDLNETGWESAELICPGTGGTMNITGSSTEVAVSENGTYTVRVTDPAGSAHEESTLVECFDTAAPTVTAGIRDKVLHCEASDDQSGVYGIMVDEKLYTTLHDGALDLRLEDYSGAGKTLSVTAIDNIGNRSPRPRPPQPTRRSSSTPARRRHRPRPRLRPRPERHPQLRLHKPHLRPGMPP